MFKKNYITLSLLTLFSASSIANPIEITDLQLFSNAVVVDGEGFGFSDPDELSSAMDDSVSSFAGIFAGEDERTIIDASAQAQTNGEFSTDARVGDIGSAQASLQQIYTITNTSNQALDVFFDFRVEEGELSTDCVSGYSDGAPAELCENYDQDASYLAEIISGNSTLFSSFTALESNAGVQVATLQEGTSLGEDEFPLDGFYSWEEQTFTGLNLGVLQAGESVELQYNITLDVSIETLLSGVTTAPVFFNGIFFDTGADFSDPFGFRGVFLDSVTTTVVNPSPEPVNSPATLGLLGLGIFGIAFGARKKRAR